MKRPSAELTDKEKISDQGKLSKEYMQNTVYRKK